MRGVRHLGGFWTNPCHRHCISMVQALLDCGCRVTELTRAVELARLLCSLVNPLGHMGLVAHLRKETELCVRVADLYLLCVCVCRSRGRYRSPQALPGTCFGIPGATAKASAGGMWKAIAGGQNHHADIDAHAHTCPCIYYSKLIDTNCHNKNI